MRVVDVAGWQQGVQHELRSGPIDRSGVEGMLRDIRCRRTIRELSDGQMSSSCSAPRWAVVPYLTPTLRERHPRGPAHWARLYPPSKSQFIEDWRNSAVAGRFCF